LHRDPVEVVDFLTADIRLTTAYLQSHPKVYWIWNHRKWCLENVPLGPAGAEIIESTTSSGKMDGHEGWRNQFWKTELRMLEAMLDADPRNCELSGIDSQY
jgi:geranylgeranyl transferase type-2 subunit alpha